MRPEGKGQRKGKGQGESGAVTETSYAKEFGFSASREVERSRRVRQGMSFSDRCGVWRPVV